LLLVGEPISAQRAYEIGLVNGVYPQAELIPQCEKWIQKMLTNGPIALKLTLEAAHRGIQMTLEEGLNLEATLFGLICTTEDMKEGTRAFLEKRAAQFKNR
jgi:enoyl-CoA hydratase